MDLWKFNFGGIKDKTILRNLLKYESEWKREAYVKTPIQGFLIQTLVIVVPRLQGARMQLVQFLYYLNSIQFVKKVLVEKIIFIIRKKMYMYILSIIILKRVA